MNHYKLSLTFLYWGGEAIKNGKQKLITKSEKKYEKLQKQFHEIIMEKP